jgi:ferredoxin
VSQARDERRAHGVRLCIDRSLCVGFGDCVDVAPEAFQLDEENIVILVDPDRVDRARLLKACDACPVDAITVWDENGEQLVP